jgi:hypothetical protein
MATEYHEPETIALTRSSTLRTALKYADEGIPVFPCKPGGKAPLTPNGYLDATTDKAKITARLNRHPRANIGAPVPEGEVVIDIDRDRYGFSSFAELEERYGELPPTHSVETGRGGQHLRFKIPEGVTIKCRADAFGLMGVDVKASGGYVLLPPSVTEGPYRVQEGRAPAALPSAWLEALREPKAQDKEFSRPNPSTIALDNDSPIPEGTRNDTLTSIAGRLHDGTRTLEQLVTDLLAVNEARCTPPLEEVEISTIAVSIHRREPCKAAPKVTPAVLAAVGDLETAASERAKRGMSGATGWSIYMAGLEAARRFGAEHPDGVELSLDLRTWAQMAGTHAATVSRFIRRCALVRQLRRGSGRRAGAVLFIVPGGIGAYLQHSSSTGVSKENAAPGSVATRPLLRTLYRLRWGPGRIGKSKAALLTAMVECPGASRFELAHRLGRKPESLKKPLKWLVDNGLAVRVGWGRYDVPEDLAERLDDARELGREPEADRLQIARHDRERDGYRNRGRVKPESHLANRKADGHIVELERVPNVDPYLRVALGEYLRSHPNRRGEYPSWLANTLWAFGMVERKPSPAAVEVALAELLEGVAA